MPANLSFIQQVFIFWKDYFFKTIMQCKLCLSTKLVIIFYMI